jgi:hypothetical protein
MIDTGIARDIDIRQLAVKARARLHIGISALCQIEHAGNIVGGGIRSGAVERHDQRHGHALQIQLCRHRHHRVGAE